MQRGLARFDTVYPGWYTGRTVHIHVKVHVGGNVIHTGQLFFDDALTDIAFKKAPYSARPARDVRNAQDSIYQSGGSQIRPEGAQERRRHTSARSAWAFAPARPRAIESGSMWRDS